MFDYLYLCVCVWLYTTRHTLKFTLYNQKEIE